MGGGNYAHRLQWFNLKEGKKHICSHCGQVFKLVTDRNFEEVKHLVDDKHQRALRVLQNTRFQRDSRASTQWPSQR